jgi:hypothetical protein
MLLLAVLTCLPACVNRPPLWIGGDPDSPLVSSRALKSMSAALALTDAQRSVAADLHAAYTAQHQAAARKYADYQRLAEEILKRDKEDDTKKRRDEATVKFARHADKLADQFLEDLRLGLNADQQANWESAMRALRRSQMLGPVYNEKSADLMAIIEGPPPLLDAGQRSKVQPSLESWESAMDAVLQRKAAFIRSTLAARLESERNEDGTARQQTFKRWRAIVREERTLNTRTATDLADALPEPLGERLRRAVHEQTYPALFNAAPTTEYLRAALALDGLKPNVNSELESLLKQDETERLKMAEKASRAFEAWERAATDDELASVGDHPDLPPEVVKGYEAHQDRVCARLAELLTAEQFNATGARGAAKSLPPIDFE